ncbi:MAG: hypothetical protein H0W88_05495 [Parachlamydiaceae bacterium]|nr:hypothetical protein [Parachlamydiaceae bacterium]
MKFAIAKEHRDFFNKHGGVEFDNFLTPEQVNQFNSAIDLALSQRLDVEVEKLRKVNSEQLFINGRDLWRLNTDLRKLVSQPRLAEIASELIESKPLRLGYDQLFPARHSANWSNTTANQVYSNFLLQSTSLEQISCLQGVLCGVMLCLSSPSQTQLENIEEEEGLDIFPSQAGNALFFQPTALFNLRKLLRHSEQRYYLVVYTQTQANYIFQSGDPLTHELKHLGYVLNDKLTDKLNPIIYR